MQLLGFKLIRIAVGTAAGFICLTGGLSPGYASAARPSGEMCLVMPGHKVKEKFFAEYKDKIIHFCCRSCVKSFKKHPERYLQRLQIPSSEKPE